MKLFISHSTTDKPFVRKLKKDLELNYIETWYDEDELQFGDSLVEKLSSGLYQSSHFIIVLSPNSVKSDWVKYELENALKYLEVETARKIIPIHYRKCQIPLEIESLLSIDLTRETVYLRNGSFELFGDTYYRNLDKLIKNLQKDDFILTESDKNSFLGKNVITEINGENFNFLFKISGFNSISNFLANQISETEKGTYNKPIENIIPVILPYQLKEFFPMLRFGDEICFTGQNDNTINGNFVKFSNTSTLSIPKKIRDFLNIQNKNVFRVSLIPGRRTIKIEPVDNK